MHLYCIKCLKFTKNKNTKIKHEIDGKINISSHCIECSLLKSYLLKGLIYL